MINPTTKITRTEICEKDIGRLQWVIWFKISTSYLDKSYRFKRVKCEKMVGGMSLHIGE